MVRPTENALVRFWSKVDKGVTTECWNWLAAKDSDGYGVFVIAHGKQMTAHRFAYEEFKGLIPLGYEIDHLCRNRQCVNPFHLEAVTTKENVLRGESHAANNARRKYCKNGHLLEGENLNQFRLQRGHRTCNICAKEYHHRRYLADKITNN